MKSEGSLSSSQKPAAVAYLGPDEFCLHPTPYFLKDRFNIILPSKPLFSKWSILSPSVLHAISSLIGEKYNLRSSSLYNSYIWKQVQNFYRRRGRPTQTAYGLEGLASIPERDKVS